MVYPLFCPVPHSQFALTEHLLHSGSHAEGCSYRSTDHAVPELTFCASAQAGDHQWLPLVSRGPRRCNLPPLSVTRHSPVSGLAPHLPAKPALSGSLTLTTHSPFISTPIFSFLHNGKILEVISDHVFKKWRREL